MVMRHVAKRGLCEPLEIDAGGKVYFVEKLGGAVNDALQDFRQKQQDRHDAAAAKIRAAGGDVAEAVAAAVKRYAGFMADAGKPADEKALDNIGGAILGASSTRDMAEFVAVVLNETVDVVYGWDAVEISDVCAYVMQQMNKFLQYEECPETKNL